MNEQPSDLMPAILAGVRTWEDLGGQIEPHLFNALAPVLARMVADAEQRGAARGWEEGWRLGVERKPGRNPYRTALTPTAAQENA